LCHTFCYTQQRIPFAKFKMNARCQSGAPWPDAIRTTPRMTSRNASS
jgi:hypothetical protein